MKILYCDCQRGFSCNSFLSALITAGLPLSFLNEKLNQLSFTQSIKVCSQTSSKNASTSNKIFFDGQPIFPDSPELDDGVYFWKDINHIIESNPLPGWISENCIKVIKRLVTAKAYALDIPEQKVRFIKSAVNQMFLELIGLTIGLDYFGIRQIFSSPIPLEHIANPILVTLLKQGQVKVTPSSTDLKHVTPLGAAFLAELAIFDTPIMVIETNGIGVDSAISPDTVNVHILIGEVNQGIDDSYVMLETNLDDMPGLAYSNLQERLILAGARDVYFTPIQMKKNRPGILVNVFTLKSNESRLANLILKETSTFGVRVIPASKYMAGREVDFVETEYGRIRIKIKIMEGKPVQVWPEYDDCEAQAQKNNVPFLQVYHAAQADAQNQLG